MIIVFPIYFASWTALAAYFMADGLEKVAYNPILMAVKEQHIVSIDRSKDFKESQSVVLSRAIANRLRASLDQEPSNPPARVGTLEDLIGAARETISGRWQREIAPTLHQEIASWIPDLAKNEKLAHVVDVLSVPQQIESKMAIRQFSDLDTLRSTHPDLWYSLVRVSMERQNAELEVLKRWTDVLAPSMFERLGTTKDGFALCIELAKTTGPLVNETFLKQMMLADTSDGSERSPHTGTLGAQYVYEIPDKDGKYVRVPYIDMFPDTWPALIDSLHKLSEKTARLVREHRVPPDYIELSAYLSTIAKTYGSKETDFPTVYALWQKLAHATHAYLLSGCPVTLSTQEYSYVTGAAGKVDAELRIGLETPKTKAYEYMLMPYQRISQKMAQGYNRALAKPSMPIKVRFQDMVYGTGSNTFWRTQGESNDKTIDVYVDSGEDVARHMVLPIYEKIFGKKLDARSVDIFIRNYVESLAVHELGHTVLTVNDEAIYNRTGTGVGSNVIEELKADVIGMNIFWEHMKESWDMDHARRMIEVLVTYSLEYILNRTSADGHGTSMYGDGGVVVLSHLLNSGALTKNAAGLYEITDPSKGFASLLGISEYICALYADPKTTPERVEQYAQYLKKHAENEKVKELIAFAKAR